MGATLSWEPDGLIRTFSGELKGNVVLESKVAVLSDKRYQSIQYEINDFSKITRFSVRPEHVDAFASVDVVASNVKHTLRVALVSPDGDLMALAQLFCDLMQKKEHVYECKTFSALEDARLWCTQRLV